MFVQGAFLLMQTLAQKQQLQLRLNYTLFFGAKALNPAITNLQVKKHSFGPVANAGIDIKLTEKVSLNTAMWYTRIKTKANFDALGLSHEVKIKLDPIVYFTGISYKF